MSLVGFRARNHPQQVAKRGARETVDERITPDDKFELLNRTHHFTVDVAANWYNAKCARYYCPERSGLEASWRGEVVWCNPPYSSIEPWLKKAHREVREGGCRKVVLIIPNNRAEQGFYQRWIEPFRDGRSREIDLSTYKPPGRWQWATPNNPRGKYKTGTPFGVEIVIIQPYWAPL